jgi:hypothetical protein
MKALVVAAALAALNSTALAGAAPEARQPAMVDAATATVIADAGRLGSASLTALNGSRWAPSHPSDADAPLGSVVPEVEPGVLLVALAALAYVAYRPLSRLLRRQEQQRRAAALAATLPRR